MLLNYILSQNIKKKNRYLNTLIFEGKIVWFGDFSRIFEKKNAPLSWSILQNLVAKDMT